MQLIGWIGSAYQAAREAAGLTRRQVADELLITESTLYRWESGRGTPHEVFRRRLWEIVGEAGVHAGREERS